MKTSDDKTLVSRCLVKDARAWSEFIDRFSPLVWWAINRWLQCAGHRYNQQDLKDIFQDVWVLLWEGEKLRQIKDRGSVSGWLAMVAANSARNYFRKTKQTVLRKEPVLEKIESSDCNASEALQHKETAAVLEGVFTHLPARERIILKLSCCYDKTHREIAKILKMPPNTVSSIIKRTKEKLKEELKKRGWEKF